MVGNWTTDLDMFNAKLFYYCFSFLEWDKYMSKWDGLKKIGNAVYYAELNE